MLHTNLWAKHTQKKASIFHVIGFIWSCRKNEGNANVKFYFQLRGTEKNYFVNLRKIRMYSTRIKLYFYFLQQIIQKGFEHWYSFPQNSWWLTGYK